MTLIGGVALLSGVDDVPGGLLLPGVSTTATSEPIDLVIRNQAALNPIYVCIVAIDGLAVNLFVLSTDFRHARRDL